MSYQAPQHNPFMLLLQPEVVLAAIENSEHLGRLNRHLCRPLDRLLPGQVAGEEPDERESPEANGNPPGRAPGVKR
jgi:hypothetical protein